MKNLYINIKNLNSSLKEKKLFSLNKWIKKILNSFNVPFVDVCCDCEEYAPMKWNPSELWIEYYDCDTKDWIPLLPDLLAASSANETSIPEGGSFKATHTLTNIGKIPTSSTITASFTKPINGTFTLDVLPTGWTVLSNTSSNIILTTNNNISVNGSVSFVFTYQHDGTNEDATRICNFIAGLNEPEQSTLNNFSTVSVIIL